MDLFLKLTAFLPQKMLIDGIDGRVDYLWIIVMFYQLFELSFWRHPFTAEDTLVSKWCNFLQIFILDELFF